MNPTITRHCPNCKKYSEVIAANNTPLICPNCQIKWGEVTTIEMVFDRCPVCDGRQFYRSKDFNQFVGCLIMLIGIILVPFTYGLSLPVFAIIDWLLARRVRDIVNCYKCATEFKGFVIPPQLKPFIHHIGLKYDKFRK